MVTDEDMSDQMSSEGRSKRKPSSSENSSHHSRKNQKSKSKASSDKDLISALVSDPNLLVPSRNLSNKSQNENTRTATFPTSTQQREDNILDIGKSEEWWETGATISNQKQNSRQNPLNTADSLDSENSIVTNKKKVIINFSDMESDHKPSEKTKFVVTQTS